MKSRLFSFLLMIHIGIFAQSPFKYNIELEAIDIPNLPGLHSFVFAQDGDKVLIIGGRKDGLHARQPFAAFDATSNNTDIYVVDIDDEVFWSASINSLDTGLKEQLQSSNMNFFQDDDTLYIVGGYAFSASANDHTTFDYLTTVNVPSLIQHVINAASIKSDFKQIQHSNFAITGGQLGKIGDFFYLVGGHRFEGRYNPMGHATYVQTYSNQIRKFKVNNTGTQLSYSSYSAITDNAHLHRRDFNLIPQIFPDRTFGYTISSGVFQTNADLPYLYPVDIDATNYYPKPTFNQYLSNYHSATATIYDSITNNMHTLFFGGMSQYYYNNGTLVKDDQVPFNKSISRLSRSGDSTLSEFKIQTEMPSLQGASAEFIPNLNLPHYGTEILKLHEITTDTILLGHIIGGISSPSINPFNSNQSNTTSAQSTIYKVKLVYNEYAGLESIDGQNPYEINVFPNPFDNEFEVEFNLLEPVNVEYLITNEEGKIVSEKNLYQLKKGHHRIAIDALKKIDGQSFVLTLNFDHKFFVSKRLIKN